MGIRVFPHSLVRYAAMDFEAFEPFRIKNFDLLLRQSIAYEDECLQLQDKICDGLYLLISAQTNDKARQKLINLKRQVFNGKPVSPADLKICEECLSEELRITFNRYTKMHREIALMRAEYHHTYGYCLFYSRNILQELAKKPVLQNGLLLASPVLLDQLNVYVNKSPDLYGQKELRVEFGLLRYLSRICFKTSPFSTFTYNGIMRLCDKQATLETTEKQVKSNLRLNNALFTYLKSIAIHHPSINEMLYIGLNRTTRVKDGQICFLVNFNNIESFQQLPAKDLQNAVVSYLQTAKKPVRFNELILALQPMIEADFAAIKIYITKLVAFGLLEPGMGVSGIDPNWDSKVSDFFEKAAENGYADMPIPETLKKVNALRSQYILSATQNRKEILQSIENEFDGLFKDLQTSGGLLTEEKPDTNAEQIAAAFEKSEFSPYHFSSRQVLYEDCFTDHIETLSSDHINTFITKTDELLNFLSPSDLMKKEREKMTRFFIKNYDKNTSVPVIDFYKEYYALVKKQEKENAKNGTQAVTETDEWEKELAKKVSAITGKKPAVVNLSATFFQRLSSPVSGQYSRGMFIQFYHHKNDDNQDLYGVINTLLPGMGKVSGRFLHMFNQQISADFVTYNNQLYPEVLKAELSDASSFNANIHPPLLHHELTMPGGNPGYADNQQLNISDIHVCYDADTKFLKLLNGTQQIYTYDLSLESFYNRSNLYQLLAHFNPEQKISLQPLIRIVDQVYTGQNEADHYILPRICYEQNLILRRKTWKVKVDSIPQPLLHETDADYFLRINIWRHKTGLPTQVFLFLKKRSSEKKTDKNSPQKQARADDYKPQFISFNQPLMVILFKRLLAGVEGYISFEEMLPDIAEHHYPNEEKRVKEYLVHWYTC